MFAHHNPMEDFVVRRRATYRQKPPKPAWRAIPDDAAEQLFSVLRCHRDRALISFWLSSGARAAELLGLRHGDLDVGARTITVISKGSRAREAIPASVDSFAWLALYLAEDRPPLIEGGPVWWTRTPHPRPLNYHAARAALQQANTVLGTNSRPGARCRDCCRSVSPGRSPNPACGSHRTGLSTVSAVRRGWRRVQGLGIVLPR